MSMSNTTDSRTTHTDALDTLGKIIGEGEKRDAVHIAVEPMVAKRLLRPGDHVTPTGDLGVPLDSAVGIVDPYLMANAQAGDHFWCFLYPRQIKSLRHVWTHPAFPDEIATSEEINKINTAKPEVTKKESEDWIREFVNSSDCPDYDTVVGAALANRDSEYLHFSGDDAHGAIPDAFWFHLENLTGKEIRNKPSYFSCSC